MSETRTDEAALNEALRIEGATVEIDVGDGCAPGRWETLPGVRSVSIEAATEGGDAPETLQIALGGGGGEDENRAALALVRGAMTYPVAIDVKITDAAGGQWVLNGAVEDPLGPQVITMTANGRVSRIAAPAASDSYGTSIR